MEVRKNKNRGYQRLTDWSNAIEYYRETCRSFRQFPYDLRRVAGQGIASVDSVHRNIAEGYCRRAINGYLMSPSGMVETPRLQGEGRLVESLEQKREQGDWIDHLIVKESNAVYGNG